MATSQSSLMIQHLRRFVFLRDAAALTDEQLLDAFISRRDDVAFEALVRRHGAMVMGVCQRVLGSHHDAEDAFQATFLVLMRKAATITPRGLLANWLYGVAYKIGLKAKAVAAKRRVRERKAAAMSEPQKASANQAHDLQVLLDEELSRLPNKYRAVIVLCDLDGKTRSEAAQHIGCPEGTVASQLARGRALLAKRLARRGVSLSAAALAGQSFLNIASANVPISLILSTSNAAILYAAGQAMTGAISSHAAALAEGVLKAMILTKLKTMVFAVLALGLVGFGGGSLLTRPTTAAAMALDDKVSRPEQPVKPADNDPKKPSTSPKSKDPVNSEASAKNQEAKPDNANDAKMLQGEWRIVDMEMNGKAVRNDPGEAPIIFTGDELISSDFGPEKMKFRLDSGKSPRELHLTLANGKFKGKTIRCIYSLENGELKLCLPSPETRATEFKTKAGDGLVLLVMRRAQKDAPGVENIKRKWLRADAPPDGNYKLLHLENRLREYTSCLVKLETKDEKQSASLVDTSEDYEVNTVRAVISPMPLARPSQAAGQSLPNPVHIRVVCTTPQGDLVFDGSFAPGSMEARGHLEIFREDNIFPAILRATDLMKLKYTNRDLLDTPLQKAVRFGHLVHNHRQNAEWEKDADEKARLIKEAALTDKKALALAPKLFQEGFEKYTDDPTVFTAAVDASRFATKYQIPAEQLRGMISKAEQAAASYGPRWQREFKLQIAAALAPQKIYASLARDIAARLEKELVPGDAAATRSRVLKALAAAEGNVGNSAVAKETLAPLLAKLEETLDREYRAKVPPFKPGVFAGRKSKSDRAVVLELFTGTECPPCVAAGVAFDALQKTYSAAELVLIEYHLHIPGPDPLANPDSKARSAYYGKSGPDETGVPMTLFNGKPEAGGGGRLEIAEEKYKQYRQLIEPLLETDSAAKLSATAVQKDNTINIAVNVADLKNPGGEVRLRLLLVEESIRYVGGNRVRFHHHVVRSLVGGADGFALNEKNSKHTATVDLDVLRASLSGYLDDFNTNWRPFPNSDRPLDFANLRLIVLVQDDATREILQAAFVEIEGQAKAAAK